MQFKSYYVVWKQKKEKTTQENKKKFKSYYVVWKHFTVKNISLNNNV